MRFLSLLLICLTLLMPFETYAEVKNSAYEQADKLVELKHYEEAIELYAKALEEDPNSLDILQKLGNSYANLGNYNKALFYYQKALSIDADYIPAKVPITVIKAITINCEPEVEKLIEFSEMNIQKKHKIQALKGLTKCYFECRDYGKVEEYINKSIEVGFEKASDYVEAYSNLAEIYRVTEKIEKQIYAYEKLLKYKDDSETRFKLAEVLYADGNIEYSRREVERLITNDSRQSSYHKLLAKILMTSEDYLGAQKEIATVLVLEPYMPEAYLVQARLYFLEKKYDQCIESFQRAVAYKSPEDSLSFQARIILGDCWYGSGNIDKAVETYDVLANEFPEHPYATFVSTLKKNIIETKGKGEKVEIEGIKFIRQKGTGSSFEASLKMVSSYMGKTITESEIKQIQLDKQIPSLADGVLFLRSLGIPADYLEINEVDSIKSLIKDGLPVVIQMKTNLDADLATTLLFRGYDDGRKTFLANHPDSEDTAAEFLYNTLENESVKKILIVPCQHKCANSDFVEVVSAKDKEKLDKLNIYFTLWPIVVISEEPYGTRLAENILKINSNTDEAKIILALSACRNKNYRASIQYFDDVAKKKNANDVLRYFSYYQLGKLYRKTANTGKSKSNFKKIDEISDDTSRETKIFFQKLKRDGDLCVMEYK